MRAILAALLLFPFAALSQSQYPLLMELKWVNPTLYEDGTDIGPGELRGTALICSRHSGEEITNVEVPSTGPGATQVVVINIEAPGTYTCYAYAITVDDIYSDASNAAEKKYTGKPRKVTLEVR